MNETFKFKYGNSETRIERIETTTHYSIWKISWQDQWFKLKEAFHHSETWTILECCESLDKDTINLNLVTIKINEFSRSKIFPIKKRSRRKGEL